MLYVKHISAPLSPRGPAGWGSESLDGSSMGPGIRVAASTFLRTPRSFVRFWGLNRRRFEIPRALPVEDGVSPGGS